MFHLHTSGPRTAFTDVARRHRHHRYPDIAILMLQKFCLVRYHELTYNFL
jgi:hypothetical protein